MKQIDLEPEDYRRDKGWRWRLKWSDPEDNKLPLVMFFVTLVAAAMFVMASTPYATAAAASVFSFCAGIMFTLWMRR